VDDGEGNAKWDKERELLIVTLPIDEEGLY